MTIDPSLAVDLGKPKEKTPDEIQAELAETLLAQEAENARQVRLGRAQVWANGMNRTFKGIRGSLGRRGYALKAIEDFDLMPGQ